MDFIQAVLLGLVQGITEFLPVSSSGHLVLMQQLMGLENVPIFFDTMLHMGTLVAVVVVLFWDIIGIFRHPIKNHLGMLIIATIPAAAAGYLLGDFFESVFKNGQFLGICFLATALILILSELIAARIKVKKQITIKNALIMGVMQAVAIFPGISRSGSTIAGGLFSGVDRTQAARFSFLMSIPIIIGSSGSSGMNALQTGMGDVSWTAVIAGTIAAAIMGYFAVKFMLAIIQKTKLYSFAVYVAILGVFVILDQYYLHLIFK
ncbi:MAG: undecaprenyl-diphosphate phosphatase [Eubacteriales bacterium]